MTISELTEQLPADQFIRIHRSYIVSKSKIEKLIAARLPSITRKFQ